MVLAIVKNCEAFCKTMTASAATLFADYVTADKKTMIHKDSKDKDPKKKYVPVKMTFKISGDGVNKLRTGAEQAALVAKNATWTCTGAHMSDKARHVFPYLNGRYVEKPSVSFKPVFEAYKKKWVAAMGTGLVNYAGNKAYHMDDQYHLELKDGKQGVPQKEVEACYVTYVDLTKDQHPKINKSIEKSAKTKLAALRKKKGIPSEEEWLQKQKEEAERAANEARLKELGKMKFKGKLSASGKFFTKFNGTGAQFLMATGNMLPPPKIAQELITLGQAKPIDRPFVFKAKPSQKTFAGVTVEGVLDLIFVEYPGLAQFFLKSARLSMAVKMSGMMAKQAEVTAAGLININLGSGVDPIGKAIIDYSIDGLLNDDHSGAMIWKVLGPKTQVASVT